MVKLIITILKLIIAAELLFEILAALKIRSKKREVYRDIDIKSVSKKLVLNLIIAVTISLSVFIIFNTTGLEIAQYNGSNDIVTNIVIGYNSFTYAFKVYRLILSIIFMGLYSYHTFNLLSVAYLYRLLKQGFNVRREVLVYFIVAFSISILIFILII